MMRYSKLAWLPAALFAGVILIVALGLHHAPRSTPAVHWVGRAAPATYLPLLRDGESAADAHFKSAAWHGRPYLVHFFASWCPDCRAEQDELLNLQAAHIPIIGILFQDRPAKAAAWLAAGGSPYVAVALDPGGRAARAWGVTAIPATFMVDGDGVIQAQLDGPITADNAQNTVMPAWQGLLRGTP